MSVKADAELVDFLDSNDLEVVKHFKNVISEKLYTSRENNLLGILIDRCIQSKCEIMLELVIGINDAHSTYLFEKLNDHLKHGLSNNVCNILFAVVKKQPSWLHKVVTTSMFATFLKNLKHDSDITFMMNGILVLCVLLPCVPAILGPHQGDILEVFVRSANLLVNKSGSIPNVCLLHLHVGVYVFFHRLYSMYPNNFLSYLKSNYGGAGKQESVFQLVIKPMFEFVKFHPDLITETRKSETSREKWKVSQPHDVLAECQKISLDPVDAIKEATFATYNDQNEEQFVHNTADTSSLFFTSLLPNNDSISNVKKDESLKHQKLALLKNIEMTAELSEICGLTTPPSSRPISPSNSAHDIASFTSTSKNDNTRRGSSQTLADLTYDRKSSGESCTGRALTKTQSVSSIENVTQKTLFKSWLSNTATHSTPASPKKTGNSRKSTQQPNKRPISSEFFRKDLIKHFNSNLSDTFSVHSAPNSPLVGSNTGQQFTFNDTTDCLDNSNNTKELYRLMMASKSPQLPEQGILKPIHPDKIKNNSTNASRSQSPAIDLSCNSINNGIPILESIKEMFSELIPPKQLPQETTGGNDNLNHSALRKTKSPLNLLDDFIQYGADVHSYQLSRIPLTSQLETDWTYFGGNTPVDELKILQTQVHLLHVQLLYERYKCDLHCLRNRRLFGNLQKCQGDIHELDVLKEQIVLGEKKLKEVLNTAQLICDDNRKIKYRSTKRQQELQNLLTEYEKKNAELTYNLKITKNKKREEKRKADMFKNELLKTKHQLFDATQELLHVQPKLKDYEKLKDTVEVLRKELVIQSEKQERIKMDVQSFHFRNNIGFEMEQQLAALRKELQVQLEEKEVIMSYVESLKARLKEEEMKNTSKATLINDQEKYTSSIQAKHKKEMKALEDRFESCRKTCQSLQTYFTSIYSKLEESHTTRTHSTSSASPHSPKVHSSSSHIVLNSHSCNDLCRRSMSHSHDHSHRHSLHKHSASDNPFSRARSTSSITNVHEALKQKTDETRVSDDSGIDRSNDVILEKPTDS